MKQTKGQRVRDNAEKILAELVSRAKTCTELAKEYGVSRDTIRNGIVEVLGKEAWIKGCGYHDYKRTGTNKLTKEEMQANLAEFQAQETANRELRYVCPGCWDEADAEGRCTHCANSYYQPMEIMKA